MRLLLIGDVHLADRPPSVRTSSYADDILAKVRWCAEYANDHDIDAVIALGDVFHVKAPSRTSHSLVIRTAEAFQAFRGTTWVVPGNHDLSADRLDSLDGQPLGSLTLADRIELADGFIPDLGVIALPYYDDFDVFYDLLQDYVSYNEAKLVVTHASIFPPGVHPPYPHMNADELPTSGVPLAYGHIHDSHGFYQVGTSWFCNNGAISRGSLHEETLRRKPKVTIFDSAFASSEMGPFISVDVPHRPAAEVFRLDDVQDKKDSEERLDDFLASVGEVSLTSLSIESVLADAQTKLSPTAMAELRDIVQEVQ